MFWYLVMLKGGPIDFPPEPEDADKPVSTAGFVTARKVFAATV
jgi:hypothetical protein